MQLTALIDRLQSSWTPTEGATVVLRKRSHKRTACIPKGNRQDLWIWSGRTTATGEARLIGRISCREIDSRFNLIPDLEGWEIE